MFLFMPLIIAALILFGWVRGELNLKEFAWLLIGIGYGMFMVHWCDVLVATIRERRASK